MYIKYFHEVFPCKFHEKRTNKRKRVTKDDHKRKRKKKLVKHILVEGNYLKKCATG